MRLLHALFDVIFLCSTENSAKHFFVPSLNSRNAIFSPVSFGFNLHTAPKSAFNNNYYKRHK